jgi:hypothetical protein
MDSTESITSIQQNIDPLMEQKLMRRQEGIKRRAILLHQKQQSKLHAMLERSQMLLNNMINEYFRVKTWQKPYVRRTEVLTRMQSDIENMVLKQGTIQQDIASGSSA